MFRHYIITRFNLRKDDWKTSKSNKPVLTEEWLSNRFELFERFCLPSVKAQSNQNFTWLVFFDTTTPENFKNRIEALSREYTNFSPVFVDGMTRYLPEIEAILKKDTAPYLITSRIDNDDAIRNDYIAEIQKQFNKQDFLALDFIDGFSLQIHPVTRLGFKRQSYNPFISLIEKNENPKSVWCKGHADWKRESRVKTIKDTRIWLQVVHAENKVNEFISYGDVSGKILVTDFGFDATMASEIIDRLVPVSQWKWTSFTGKFASFQEYYFRKVKIALGYYKIKK